MRRPRGWFNGAPRWYLWVTGAAVVVAVLLVVGAFFLDEPLRRLTERQMNERLKSHTATVGRLEFHPIGVAIELRDVVFVQNANPDPPVMRVEQLSANIKWTALIRGRLVADVELVRPVLHLDRDLLEAEKQDRGWQDALQAIYPFKINTFEIHDGEATYVEAGQSHPLRMSKITVVAQDILNVRSDAGAYPSPVRVEAMVFDGGRALFEGHADFLAEPHVGVKGNVELADIALDSFRPVLERANVVVTRGTFNGKGLVEYTPQFKKVDLEELRVDGLYAEYVYYKSKAAVVKEAVKTTVQAAKEISNDPGVVLHARKMTVTGATVGFLNKDTSPNYRVFMSDANLTIENFSNQKSEGYGHARLRGRFMGSGQAAVDVALRAENKGPDFDLNARIENVDVRKMNDLLRAYAKIDVASGVFSVFSEIDVKNARVNGYVKPLFKDLDVYDKEQDEDKSLGKKLKEKAADVVAEIFKNRPRDEVATIASVDGPLGDPKASTWEVLVNLVRNAFFQAILPGFERQARSGPGDRVLPGIQTSQRLAADESGRSALSSGGDERTRRTTAGDPR